MFAFESSFQFLLSKKYARSGIVKAALANSEFFDVRTIPQEAFYLTELFHKKHTVAFNINFIVLIMISSYEKPSAMSC